MCLCACVCVCASDLHGGNVYLNMAKNIHKTRALIHLTKSVNTGVAPLYSFGDIEVGLHAFVGDHGDRVNTLADAGQ